VDAKDSDDEQGTSNPRAALVAAETRVRVLANLKHELKLLLDFMDEDLSEIIDVRAEIAAGAIKEIYFEDLWHLLRPGDLILTSRGPNQQLLRICSVTGGQLQLRNQSRQESEHYDRLRESMAWKHRNPTKQLRIEDVLREEASGLGVWYAFFILYLYLLKTH
jgi:hypothetical protein